MEIDAIKYVGGPHHISILYRNKEDNKLFVLYCYTGKPIINVESEYQFSLNDEARTFTKAEINIPLTECREGAWYQVVIEREKDFELVDNIVASIMEGDG